MRNYPIYLPLLLLLRLYNYYNYICVYTTTHTYIYIYIFLKHYRLRDLWPVKNFIVFKSFRIPLNVLHHIIHIKTRDATKLKIVHKLNKNFKL